MLIEMKILGEVEGKPVATVWSYDPAVDPFAATVTFYTPAPVPWLFARELLFQGLSDPAGKGDFRVLPGFNDIAILLTSDKSIVVKFDRRSITEFCDKMQELVPGGTEGNHIDWDAELKLLED